MNENDSQPVVDEMDDDEIEVEEGHGTESKMRDNTRDATFNGT